MPDTVWQIGLITLYCELLSISGPDKKSFYEKDAANSGWSVREPKRKSIAPCLWSYCSTMHRQRVAGICSALKGNEITTPAENICDSYVFVYLGLSEDKPMILWGWLWEVLINKFCQQKQFCWLSLFIRRKDKWSVRADTNGLSCQGLYWYGKVIVGAVDQAVIPPQRSGKATPDTQIILIL